MESKPVILFPFVSVRQPICSEATISQRTLGRGNNCLKCCIEGLVRSPISCNINLQITPVDEHNDGNKHFLTYYWILCNQPF